jgi:uncharacterized protein (TIGR02266 family)
MGEQGRAPRIRALGLSVRLDAAGKQVDCVAENISRGGLFARTDEDLPVGTPLRIDVVRPGWKQALSLGGRVVRKANWRAIEGRSPPGVGIQFSALDERLQVKLQQALIALRTASRRAQQAPGPEAQAGALSPEVQASLPPTLSEVLDYFKRRCDQLNAEVARRDQEVARLKAELQAARARLLAIDLGPGSPNRTDS